ncbi:MAG: hypothetical protein R3A79_07610 [Nannocystaceae bacterium]
MRGLPRIAVAAALVAVAVAACGEEDVPKDTRLDALDADEFAEVCLRAVTRYVDEVGQARWHKEFCVDAEVASGDVAACEAAVDACLTEPYSLSVSQCVVVADLERCTATVEELDACFDEERGRISAYIDALSCASAIGGAAHEGFAGPACLAFGAKCPRR